MLYNPSVSFLSGDVIRVVLTSINITIYKNSVPYYSANVGSGVLGTKIGIGIYQDGVSTLNEVVVKV